MNECLFCKIVNGGIPCEKVYEDTDVLAFLDIHPINRGHTLVIPKQHANNIYDIPEEGFEQLMRHVHRLAPTIKEAVDADGINIGMNNDGAAGQLVFHAHVHIIPRFTNDGFRHWHGAPYTDGAMRATADAIKGVLENKKVP